MTSYSSAKTARKSVLPLEEIHAPPTAVGRALRKEMRAGPNLREHIGYETSPPACRNCKHYRPHTLELPPRCAQFLIEVSKNAVCDHWIDGQTGAGLAAI